jgi:Protein of unknown function (DUF664)
MVDLDEPAWAQSDPAGLLLDYLDFYRDTVRRKVAGLSTAQLQTSVLPSGWTPVELVVHLTFMERRWLQWGFAALPLPDPFGDDDPVTGRWQAPASSDVTALLAQLTAAGHRTRELTAGSDLARRAGTGGRFPADALPPTLGWILLHVLQEYARHVGQLDVVRELIDGAVGE